MGEGDRRGSKIKLLSNNPRLQKLKKKKRNWGSYDTVLQPNHTPFPNPYINFQTLKQRPDVFFTVNSNNYSMLLATTQQLKINENFLSSSYLCLLYQIDNRGSLSYTFRLVSYLHTFHNIRNVLNLRYDQYFPLKSYQTK